MDIPSLLELAVQYGIFPALFIVLLVYVIKNNDKRECEYRMLVNKLNDDILAQAKQNSAGIGQLSKDVDIVDDKLHKIDQKVDDLDKKVGLVSDKVDTLTTRVTLNS